MKGGVGIALKFHNTSMAFINCHLPARLERTKMRNTVVMEIMNRIQLANKDGDHYIEDLDAEKFEALLDDLAAGKKVKFGPQSERNASEPHGTEALTDPSLYDGSKAKPIKLPNTEKEEG